MDHPTPASEPPLLVETVPAKEIEAITLADPEERGQVTVHCSFVPGLADAIRIWPTTYLVCRRTGQRSQLLHAEGIPLAPTWKAVRAGNATAFILLFAALPRECDLFDLVEEIADPGGFHVSGIARNTMDVYRVAV